MHARVIYLLFISLDFYNNKEAPLQKLWAHCHYLTHTYRVIQTPGSLTPNKIQLKLNQEQATQCLRPSLSLVRPFQMLLEGGMKQNITACLVGYFGPSQDTGRGEINSIPELKALWKCVPVHYTNHVSTSANCTWDKFSLLSRHSSLLLF